MVDYKFILKIKNSNDQYEYYLSLNPAQEDYPETIFTRGVRENMRQKLQRLSSCKINNNSLDQMIKVWIQDIKEGYRDSTLVMNLPPLLLGNIEDLNDTGNQTLPTFISPDLTNMEPSFGMLPPLVFH